MIYLENQHPGLEADLAGLRRFCAQARRRVGVRGELAVRLMDDASMRALNRAFRGHDAATDVLSFASGVPTQAGNLAVSLDRAQAQARARRHSLDTEVRILLLHGLLHLAGYDHEQDGGEMRTREVALRRALGLPPGLIERAHRRKMVS